MTTTKETKTAKKPKRNKAKTRMSLKEYIPNYRDFQKEVARLEEMLGPEAALDVASDLPRGMSREWAQDAWPIVIANAQRYFSSSKSGTEFPSGVYADRAMWALLVVSESPFNDKLRGLAISQILDIGIMERKSNDRRIRAEKRAAKSAETSPTN